MSADNHEGTGEGFFLTPHQQNLLFAALNTNKQQVSASATQNPVSVSPSSFKNSPGNSSAIAGGYQDSPFLDNYDYEFADSSFDFSFAGNDQAAMIGDMPSTSDKSDTPDDDIHEKRSYPDDDDEALENDAKRREAGEKVPKKPGRKPLTSEPTSVCCRLPYQVRDIQYLHMSETQGAEPCCSEGIPREKGEASQGS